MNTWTVLHLLSVCVYFALAVYVVSKNSRSALNRSAAGLFLCFALWGFGNSLLYSEILDVESAAISLRITSPGWLFFSSFYLIFITAFTGRKKLLKNYIFYAILFIPPLFTYYHFLRGDILSCCREVDFGLMSDWKDNIWVYFFYFYYSVFIFAGFYMLAVFYRRQKNVIQKRLSVILFFAALICFIGGTALSVVLKEMKIYYPIEGPLVIMIFAFAIIYAIAKYEFMVITPGRAAGDIINTVKDCLILVDTEGSAVITNKYARDMLEDAGKNAGGSISGWDIFDRETVKRIKAGGEIKNTEVVLKSRQEGDKTLLFSCTPFREKNKAIGSVCILKDITDRKAAETEIKETVKELKRSNEELERFAYVASHDLKEPLRMVSAYIQLLEKRYGEKLEKDAGEYIKFAVDGARRMGRLLDDLLDYSRVNRKGMEFEKCDSKEIVESIVLMLKFKIQDSGGKVEIKGDLSGVYADSTQVRSVFQNLIENSIKFAGKQPPEIIISAQRQGNMVKFRVSDNGRGINPKYNEKIFEIFQRLHGHDKYEGTGIGLAICKKIVQRHGGDIWAGPGGEGKGANFYFTLPAAEGQEPE